MSGSAGSTLSQILNPISPFVSMAQAAGGGKPQGPAGGAPEATGLQRAIQIAQTPPVFQRSFARR